jgi:hypothetical protein
MPDWTVMGSSSASGIGHIKGAAIREFVIYCRAALGAEVLAAHVRAMPRALAQELEIEDAALGVLSSEWYRAELVHALLDQIVRDKSEAAVRELAAGASSAVMRATLRGLYRVLFQWMATPERYARYAPKLWASYYDSGETKVELTPGGMGAISTIRNWRSHHPLICELNRGAGVEIYTAMGCVEPQVESTRCISRGDPECQFVARWYDVKR